MKAITQDRYGNPDVLELADVPQPELQDDRLLVRMRAASVNPFDWHMMSGTPWLVRVTNGLRRPKAPPGADGAGVVESVGPAVTGFSPGDEVWGSFRGSYAEYATTRERAIVPKPAEVSFEEAAATPIAGLTALQGLRDIGRLKQGDRVLVNGASGGVGTFAVQIAKAMGAHVTAVVSTPKLDMVRSIGADEAVDYTTDDYTKGDARYDLILDCVTTKGVIANRRVMADDGVWVQAGMKKKGSVVMLMLRILKLKLMNIGSSKKMRNFLSRSTKEDLEALSDLLASGAVKPVIDRTFPLSATADGLRYQGEGHARGKTVITI
jgi:NADPH:quinone reductase-like Zn-dependent oxidoreductase